MLTLKCQIFKLSYCTSGCIATYLDLLHYCNTICQTSTTLTVLDRGVELFCVNDYFLSHFRRSQHHGGHSVKDLSQNEPPTSLFFLLHHIKAWVKLLSLLVSLDRMDPI